MHGRYLSFGLDPSGTRGPGGGLASTSGFMDSSSTESSPAILEGTKGSVLTSSSFEASFSDEQCQMCLREER